MFAWLLALFKAIPGLLSLLEMISSTFAKLKREYELRKRAKELKEEAEKSVEALKKAKTEKEINDAARSALDDF